MVEIGRFHARNFPNVKYDVTIPLKPVLGKFYDDWLSIGLFSSDVEQEFIEYVTSEALATSSEYAFGFVTQLKLFKEKKIATRQVYNIFQFASDFGGLQGALDLVFGFAMSFFTPVMLTRSILRHNYKFDTDPADGTQQSRDSDRRLQAAAQEIRSK